MGYFCQRKKLQNLVKLEFSALVGMQHSRRLYLFLFILNFEYKNVQFYTSVLKYFKNDSKSSIKIEKNRAELHN